MDSEVAIEAAAEEAVASEAEEAVSAVDKVILFRELMNEIGFDQGPPEYVEEIAEFSHACEGMLICNMLSDRVPLLMRHIYLQNKNRVGKVDDVFGPMSKPGIAI